MKYLLVFYNSYYQHTELIRNDSSDYDDWNTTSFWTPLHQGVYLNYDCILPPPTAMQFISGYQPPLCSIKSITPAWYYLLYGFCSRCEVCVVWHGSICKPDHTHNMTVTVWTLSYSVGLSGETHRCTQWPANVASILVVCFTVQI